MISPFTAMEKAVALTAAVLVLASAAARSCPPRETEAQGVDWYAPENVLRFADYLYESGDYLRAAGEYERYLILTDEPPGADSVYYRLVKSLSLGGAYDQCVRFLDEFPRRYPSSPMSADVSLYRSIVEFRRRNYRGSLELARVSKSPDEELRRRVIAMSCLHLRDTECASRWACGTVVPGDAGAGDSAIRGPAESRASALCERIREAKALPMKRAWLAGTLSAVVPGAGKAYCERPFDGLHSLLVVGLTVWLSYDGFDENGSDSVMGWVFGVLGGTFYFGNIYGSVLAARLHNEDTYGDFLRGVEIDVSLP